MKIRCAVPNDAEAIGRIRVNAWRSAYKDLLPPEFLGSLDPGENLDRLGLRLGEQSSSFFVYVAEIDGVLQGFSISGKPRYNVPEQVAELWALNIEPNYWRRGLGFSLLDRSCNEAREHGASSIELWCISGNLRARTLYERYGFQLSGRERTTTGLTGHPIHELCYEYDLNV